jgi:hypothetical protein
VVKSLLSGASNAFASAATASVMAAAMSVGVNGRIGLSSTWIALGRLLWISSEITAGAILALCRPPINVW